SLSTLSILLITTGCSGHSHKHTKGVENLKENKGLYWSNKGVPIKHDDLTILYSFEQGLTQDLTKGCLNAIESIQKNSSLQFTQTKVIGDANLTFVVGELDRSQNHQGTTQVSVINDIIVRAEVKFDREIPYSTNPSTTEVDAESVCLHEIGHAIG